MNNQFLDSLAKYLRETLTVVLLSALLLLSPVALASEEASSADVVGEVSLLLGKAYIDVDGQARKALRVGSEIRVSDRIVTGASGHVHIRFIDQALVSVRPSSRLDVVRYDFKQSRPEDSSVKFHLREGVTRAISGEAAKAARQRFRLNTPIAAIGVRGTDFVVSATQKTTRALVNEGAIVLAPYSSACSAESYGPCALNAVELTDNSLQLIELEGTALAPQLLPAPHERDPSGLRDDVEVAVANNASEDEGDTKTISSGVYLESVTSTKVTAEAAIAAPALSLAAKGPDFTPGAQAEFSALSSKQLVWGRWADGEGDLERITTSFEQASIDRKVTVGNDDYILFRSENDGTRVERGLGFVSFALDSAQAFYSSDSGVVAMQVKGGSLGIDFEQSRFSTELNLFHGLTGSVNFAADGRISDGGYFNSRSDTQRIAGSVTTDGNEAGYFFERQLQGGGIQGLTLWDRQ